MCAYMCTHAHTHTRAHTHARAHIPASLGGCERDSMRRELFHIGDTGNNSDPSPLNMSPACANIEICQHVVANCSTG